MVLAIPQYFVLAGLAIAACAGIIAGFFAVLFTGEYPEGIRGFLVSAYRYTLRVEAHVGFLTDRYPPSASPRKAAASPAPLAMDARGRQPSNFTAK